MNESFRSLIHSSLSIAHDAGLSWDIALDIHGVAHKGHAWDLQLLSKSGKPQKLALRTPPRHNRCRLLRTQEHGGGDEGINWHVSDNHSRTGH
jgi:hypothetical protein